MTRRGKWCGDKKIYVDYHDQVWGMPVHDDCLLFEMLTLEGAQAGLSWLTILKKQANYVRAFDGFNIRKIAKYTEKDIDRLLDDAGIVRNLLKIQSVIKNAKGTLKIQEEFGSLDAFLWDFVGGKPKQNTWRSMGEIPAMTTESNAMGKTLKKRGFNFVGSTICYAFMQATGMVNDHVVSCYRHKEVKKLG